MGLDLDKIADDLGLPRDKFRAGAQRIQLEQKAVAWVSKDLPNGECWGAMAYRAKCGAEQVQLFTFPPATPSAVPDGWQLVPKEPTREMLMAIGEANCLPLAGQSLRIYDAALSAAPAPVGEKKEGE